MCHSIYIVYPIAAMELIDFWDKMPFHVMGAKHLKCIIITFVFPCIRSVCNISAKPQTRLEANEELTGSEY
jgi:hypothetical protein